MSRPKIKTALIGVFVLIGIIVTSFAVYSVNRLEATNDFVDDIATEWMPSLGLAKTIELNLANLRVSFRDHILSLTVDKMKAIETKIEADTALLLDNITRYEALQRHQSEIDITRQIRADMKDYIDLGAKMRVMSEKNDNENAKNFLFSNMVPVGNKIRDEIAKLVEVNEQGANKSFEDSKAIFSTTLIMTFVAIGLCGVVIAVSIWFAMSGIAKPIETITTAMKALAAGDSQSTIPFEGRADEIGEMAAAVEVFRANAVTNAKLERDAVANRDLTEDERRRKAEADRIAAEAMAKATSGLASGLKHLSSGNLSFKLDEAFAPDFESLRADFNAAVTQLADTLRAVAQAGSQIDSGAREVSQSANDLSKRTEQQAAALEETAAALDEITVNVSSSSKRADEARNIAVQANESAIQSGKVVASAVDAMQKIEQSSNEVSNIISVIDEIAFQTNLLALNAGVEAARAGDAGKGFAVVAQEVRELAQRSAQAAREIKDLIRNSSVEVQSGVKLVSDTGDALRTIEGYIVTVNQHMDAIATSAREQSVGLAEVNTAVNQMDQVTQQNAAMVEESTAASATLATEANRLGQLIGQFQLGVTAAPQQMAQRRTASAVNGSRSFGVGG